MGGGAGRTGDINAGATTVWPLLDRAQQRVMVLDTPIAVGAWENAACDFWVRALDLRAAEGGALTRASARPGVRASGAQDTIGYTY